MCSPLFRCDDAPRNNDDARETIPERSSSSSMENTDVGFDTFPNGISLNSSLSLAKPRELRALNIPKHDDKLIFKSCARPM